MLKKLAALQKAPRMAETDVADLTFYSATDQITNRKIKRQPAHDGRREAERLAFESDTGMQVTAVKKPVSGFKITSRAGKSVSSAKTSVAVQMAPSEMPGQDAARRQALEMLVRERAKQLAVQNSHKK
jgi:hypothetical protein